MSNVKSLLSTFGIGFKTIKQWGAYDGLNPKNTFTTKHCVARKMQAQIDTTLVGTILLDQTKKQLKLAKHLKSYKGVRHIVKLPCRGQRTRTNAQTKKKFKC